MFVFLVYYFFIFVECFFIVFGCCSIVNLYVMGGFGNGYWGGEGEGGVCFNVIEKFVNFIVYKEN